MSNFNQLLRFGDHTETQKQRLIDYVTGLVIDENMEYEAIVRPYKKSKTKEQLGYYFSTVVPVACAWQGLVADDGDMWLRSKCVIPEHREIMGEMFEIRPSISKMKIDVMSKYIDDCINFLGSHGEYVPPPRYTDKG